MVDQLIFYPIETYDVVIISEFVPVETIFAWGDYGRATKTKIIVCSVSGTFGRIYNDFGDEFIVLDKNGEEV
jgi:ubiquitin-activating enzyme E1